MGRKKTSYVYKFFTYDELNKISVCQCRNKCDAINLNSKSKCKPKSENAVNFNFNSANESFNLCLMNIKGSKTSNLKHHLRHRHPDEFLEVVRLDSQSSETTISTICIKSVEVEDNLNSPSECYVVKKRKIDSTHNKTKLRISLPENEIIKGILQLIVLDGCCPEIVEGEGLRTLLGPVLSGINFKLNAVTVENLISERAREIRTKITTKLSQCPLINIKLDCTTANNRSFVSIQCQLLENIEDRLTQHVFTLGCVEIFDCQKQTVEEIIMSLLTKYEVPLEKIHVIVTENGSRLLRAEQGASNLSRKENTENIDPYLGVEIEDADVEMSDDILGTLGEFAVNEIRCLAHDILKCVQNALQCKIENVNVQNYLQIIEKAWNSAQNYDSGTTVSLKNDNMCAPDLRCHNMSLTSTYSMMKYLLKSKKETDELGTLDSNSLLSDDEWEIVEEFVFSLAPIYNAALQMQDSQLLLCDLYKICKLCHLETSKLGTSLSNYLLEAAIEKQLALFKDINFKSSLFLDPRFLVELNYDDKKSVIDYLSDLYKHYENVLKCHEDHIQSNSIIEYIDVNDSEVLLEEHLRNKERLQQQYGTSIIETDENELQAEFNAYLGLPRLQLKGSVLKFWEEKRLIFPKLYILAIVIHSIMCTQTSATNLYSPLKYALNSSKQRLHSDMLEDILLLRMNYKTGIISNLRQTVSDIVGNLEKRHS